MFRNIADNPLLLIVLVLIIVLVFGANKLPGAARSLGRSMRIFKSEVRQMGDDDDAKDARQDDAPSRPLEGKVVDDRRGPRTDRAGDADRGRETDDEVRGRGA